MSNETLAIILTAVLAVAALGWTLWGAQRLRGTHHLLRGLGLALVPVGLWLTGVMELVAGGLRAVVQYFRDASLDTLMISGLVVTVLGLALFFGANMIEPRSRARSKELRAERASKHQVQVPSQRNPAAVGSSTSSAPTGKSSSPATAQPQPRGKNAGLSDEDAEIEALLRKRGIE